MQNTSEEVVGVSEEEEEDGDGEGRVDDVPLGQQPLDQRRTPHLGPIS